MEIARYAKRLEVADLGDPEVFRSLLAEGMRLFGLNDMDVANLIDVSRSSVTRWREGVTSPYPVVREVVRDEFLKMAKEG